MPTKEIIPLYRIYDKVNKEYLPLIEYFVDGNGRVSTSNYDAEIENIIKQDNYIIEKCSQKPDKNKIYIYEGDKFIFQDKEFTCVYNEYGLVGYNEKTDDIIGLLYSEACEIIGNIHD